MSPRQLCALVGAALVPCLAQAGVLVPKEPGLTPLKVRKQTISVQVKDQVARATVDEVFESFADRPLEASYLMSLPEGAAVSGFATWVDGVRVESRVEEKADAAKAYEKAKEERQQPAMLEKDAPNTFRMRVDGIPPHGTKRVETAFAQILPYDSGVVTLRLPLAVAGQAGAEPVSSFQLSVGVEDQKKIADLKVLSHAAQVRRVGESRFEVSYEAKDVKPDKELVLTYRTESSRLGLTFVPFKPAGEKDGYFLLLASPQELTSAADIVRKDVLFVFDTSGSMMMENKIQQTRDALKRCLANLNAEDRFGIVAFSDSTNPFKNALVPASAENVREAMAFAEGLAASGGTNIAGALGKGLELLGDGERPRVVVFMTDGVPTIGTTDPDAIMRIVAERNVAKARLFSFGVGSDINRTFLERLSKDHRGSHDFVERGQSIDDVVGGFYAKIAKPVLSELAFEFGAVTTAMQYPDVLPDLYKGSQLVLVGRYRGSGKVAAALKGTINGKKLSLPFEASFPETESQNGFVARLWAQRRIDFLLSQNRLAGEKEEAKGEVIALSRQYNIVTPYTSFVAVRTEEQKVAMVFPARVKPGDPTIWVRAPRDARAVRVHLPFGEVKTARWDADREVWAVRFLVPAGTPEGTYDLRVEIEHADGRLEIQALAYAIDTTAPVMTAWASRARAGEPIRLAAVATIAVEDVLRALAGRSDHYEALKATFDVRRVTARLWDGREVQLDLEPGGLGFHGIVETSLGLAPGDYPIVLTAQDYAGNVSQTTAHAEIR